MNLEEKIKLLKYVVNLEAEIARLRAALREIAEHTPPVHGYAAAFTAAAAKARKALEEK